MGFPSRIATELELQKGDLMALVGARKQNHCKTQQVVYNKCPLLRLKNFLRKCIPEKERDSLPLELPPGLLSHQQGRSCKEIDWGLQFIIEHSSCIFITTPTKLQHINALQVKDKTESLYRVVYRVPQRRKTTIIALEELEAPALISKETLKT